MQMVLYIYIVNKYDRLYAAAQLVEALRYKPEGRRFDSCGVIRIFHLHNPSRRTMALGLTQPPTEMSTRNISWG
jgi:coproporphyrinogen III oxidase